VRGNRPQQSQNVRDAAAQLEAKLGRYRRRRYWRKFQVWGDLEPPGMLNAHSELNTLEFPIKEEF
jgi:hypothetical protein